MLTEKYSNNDLVELTTLARTLWEYDTHTSPKRIKRRQNVLPKNVPLQAICRMVKEDCLRNDELNKLIFPFVESNFHRVLGLSEGWVIGPEDRKFIEKDMVLFDSNGYDILILPVVSRWWESSWFNFLSISLGLVGLVGVVLAVLRSVV